MAIEIEAAVASLDAMQKRVDIGTRAGLKRVQTVTKTSIKNQMKGRPRWDRRGRSKVFGMGINLNLQPHHVSRRGGPGVFTGSLLRSIRSSKRPRVTGDGGFSGVVMSGGAGGPQNLYKRETEAKYPYFAPGVNKAKPKMEKIWAIAWEKATRPEG